MFLDNLKGEVIRTKNVAILSKLNLTFIFSTEVNLTDLRMNSFNWFHYIFPETA